MLLRLADTVLILINTGPSNVKLFGILRTKISFLVVKVMGALPDAEAGWVQAFPCCFGA